MTIPLTRAQLESRRIELAKAGQVLSGDHDTITQYGVTLRLDYDESKQQLDIEVLKKPFYMPTAMVDSKISQWFQQDS